MTGDEFASTVHVMLLDATKAVSIPLVVSSAAKGDYGPLEDADSAGLDATGPVGHRLRQLHDRPDRGFPERLLLGRQDGGSGRAAYTLTRGIGT